MFSGGNFPLHRKNALKVNADLKRNTFLCEDILSTSQDLCHFVHKNILMSSNMNFKLVWLLSAGAKLQVRQVSTHEIQCGANIKTQVGFSEVQI